MYCLTANGSTGEYSVTHHQCVQQPCPLPPLTPPGQKHTSTATWKILSDYSQPAPVLDNVLQILVTMSVHNSSE